eukprot:4518462-Heterocapsa_arctica.AAC.1
MLLAERLGFYLLTKEIEPGVNVIENILVNWIRQTEGGLHPSTEEHWDEFNIQTGNVRGPINYFRVTMQKLG